MGELVNLVVKAKENDEKAMLKILEIFEPLIKKYHRLLGYDEDLKQEIIFKIVKLIKIEIILEKLRTVNDNVLLKYISDSVYHHYIYLSKNKRLKESYEMTEFSEEIMADISGINFNDDFIIIDLLKSILTEKEFISVYYTEIMDYTSEETAKMLHISKQACNQRKLRALEKIKHYYGFVEN